MVRSRIAPTPSGYLHIGNAVNFVLIWLWVRQQGGILRLRIDDRDTTRAKPEFIEDIFRSLDWLGLDWDEGPQTPDEETRIYSQALRIDRYEQVTRHCIDTGQVFACECSRRDMHIYMCTCGDRHIPLDRPDTALRIITPSSPILVTDVKAGAISVSLGTELENFIIRRRDGMTAYQLASLVDDMDFHIDLIIRGQDLLTSTAAQLYLASLIGAGGFQRASFYHHTMITDGHGQKLSKSSGSPSLRAMQESGMAPADFYIRLSGLMGWPEACTSLHEILRSGFVPL